MPKPRQPGLNSLRIETSNIADGRRWLVGVVVASKCDRATAALIALRGKGLQVSVDIVGARTAAIPRTTTILFDTLASGNPCAATTLATLRTQLAEVTGALTLDLLESLSISPSRILAVGVDDPGIWEFSDISLGSPGSQRLSPAGRPPGSPRASHGEPTGYLGLCDPARLAEATGMNVVDAFPARDVAAGGLGGPLAASAHWILLRAPLRNRLLLDLGRTVRLTYLPAARGERPETDVLSFEVGPGASLLDSLANRLTGGQDHFDPGGRLAVQGKRIPELLAHWLANPYFDCPPPRWHPRGVRPERFLADAVRMAVSSDWSVRDMLCTATHFIAEMIARTTQHLPESNRLDEIVVTGGGQHNGLLLHEIGRLTRQTLVRLDDLGFPPDSFEASSIALLAMLHLDQVQANSSEITKTASPRLLGRLTGGSPQSWQLLLEICAGNSSAIRPLRSAI